MLSHQNFGACYLCAGIEHIQGCGRILDDSACRLLGTSSHSELSLGVSAHSLVQHPYRYVTVVKVRGWVEGIGREDMIDGRAEVEEFAVVHRPL